MNAQHVMLTLLETANNYYTSPIKDGWQKYGDSPLVFATHNATGIHYFFKFDPASKVITIKSFNFNNSNSIKIYTGSINIGGHIIAPDMILALHTLFNFDFASDAIFVVENNRAKKIPPARSRQKLNNASDNSPAAKRPASSHVSSHHHSSHNRSRVSKVLRALIYFELPFRR